MSRRQLEVRVVDDGEAFVGTLSLVVQHTLLDAHVQMSAEEHENLVDELGIEALSVLKRFAEPGGERISLGAESDVTHSTTWLWAHPDVLGPAAFQALHDTLVGPYRHYGIGLIVGTGPRPFALHISASVVVVERALLEPLRRSGLDLEGTGAFVVVPDDEPREFG